MTPIQRKLVRQQMTAMAHLLCDGDDATDAVLLINADSDNQMANTFHLGDVQLLGGAVISQLVNNIPFRQFLLSAVGAYLNNNPEIEREFLSGLHLAKNSSGIN